MKALLKKTSPWLFQRIKHLKRFLKKIIFHGTNKYCPVCNSHIRVFHTFGEIPRPNALCPICDSVERHRLDWIFLERNTNLLDKCPKRLLHIGAEPEFERKFREYRHINYLSADLNDSHAMVKMDITNIQYPDNSFDIIYCSHVLEHVPEDRKAMREIYRVLKPGGWTLLQVPITCERTFEYPNVKDPQEREKLFGQHDHVRSYGHDYIDRLKESGFTVKKFTSEEVLGDINALVYMGIPKNEFVFFCQKKQLQENIF